MVPIQSYCHALKKASDKEEAVQLIYFLKDIINRQ